MTSLDGLKVLVVEDRVQLALYLCELLCDLGCEIIGPAGCLPDALALAQDACCDIGLIDVDLRGEPSYPVSDILQARQVPVILITGFAAESIPAPYASLAILEKPIEPDQLLQSIRQQLVKTSLR